jgi:hypothetical protein
MDVLQSCVVNGKGTVIGEVGIGIDTGGVAECIHEVKGELIPVGNLVVESQDVLVHAQVAARDIGVVLAILRGVRLRHIGPGDLLRDGIDRNLVVGVGKSGIGAHQLGSRQESGEVAVFLRGGENIAEPCGLLDRTQALVTEKEERTVLDDRAAEGPAELVLLQHLLARRSNEEEIAGVHGRVAEELKDVAVERVGAGPELDVSDRAGATTIFRFGVAGKDPELLDSIDRGIEVHVGMAVVDHGDAVYVDLRPGDLGAIRTDGRAVLAGCVIVRVVNVDAGREDGKIVESTAVQRKILCALRPHNDTKRSFLALQQGLSGGAHFDRLLRGAGLQGDVDPRLLVNLQLDTLLLAGSKSTGRDGHVIGAGSEVGDAVFAVSGSDGLLLDTRGDRRDDDVGAGNDGSAIVCNGADDRGIDCLRMQRHVENDKGEEEK